ncbi:MAG: potassium-transporting ATPase subunit KdpC [Gemmatimonadota bacterium]|nr:potassium-transporting ATPase subunit KdpC [Gemmatimonadota bacterium]
MMSHMRPAIGMTVLLMALTGVVYPGIVTGIAQLLLPSQANGSLVEKDGKPVGSALIGQAFAGARYFHARPSNAGSGYDASASSGTNTGPTDARLADTLIAGAVAKAVAEDGAEKGKIPSDYVTASGSGLDPHISPASAELQVARVARARGLDAARVRDLVARHTEGPQLGILGDPRVNVLRLNLALDSIVPRPDATAANPPTNK